MTSDKTCLLLYRQYAEARAKCRCEVCGAPEGDPHHIYTRENKAVRYDAEYNAIWLCSPHHRWAEKLGTLGLINFLVRTGLRTAFWESELIKRKNQIVKFNDQYREDWKQKLLKQLEVYRGQKISGK